MPIKASGPASEYREIDRTDHEVGWVAYPEETMQRASHAVAVDGEVYVLDPVDVPDLDDLLGELGEVAGVVTLLDRHKRDAATLANRHDVAVYVPEWMSGVADDLAAPTERVSDTIPGTDLVVHRLIDNAAWQEAVLEVESRDTLVVPEAVGTADYFVVGDERLGVHPMLRLTPPTKLKRFSPDRVLVGHGAGVHEGATEALSDAISGARARTPVLYAKAAKDFLLG